MKKLMSIAILSVMLLGVAAQASAELQPPKRGVPNPSIEQVGWKLKLRP